MTLRNRVIFVIVGFLVISFGCSKGQDEKLMELEKNSIRTVFSDFQNALTKHDSTNINEYLTQESVEEFGEYKDLALYASEVDLQALSVMKRLYVLSLRHLLTEGKLQTMGKTDILPFLMDKEITLSGTAMLHFELDHIAIKDEAANVWFKFKGEKFSDFTFLFLKQEGKWKLDIRSLLMLTEGAVASQFKQQNIPENDAVIIGLETATGRKVSPNIWQPLKPEQKL